MTLPEYPALLALPALRSALDAGGLAVLAAPPGSGKTTTIPLALLSAPWLKNKKILLLEPRRVAARAAAKRMAQLLGEKVGQTVGYQIRFERKVSDATRIEVITEGLLTRRLQSDPELDGVGLVIFDEFHERSLDADLALALTLESRDAVAPELRVVVMSATLDTQRVAALLGQVPVVEAAGRMFEVDLRYAPMRADGQLDEAMTALVGRALQETRGDILCFLPGAREIRNVQRLISNRYPQIAVYPLYGELSSEAQDAALSPDPQGHRKVILATNIAQTSLTVEGVTTVVDSGLVRVARFDLGAGANRLDTQKIARASADQRAGRAGRLGPGVCYRLWSQEQHGRLQAHDPAEIVTADVTRFALELARWGVTDPAQLRLLDLPPLVHWRYATQLLQQTGTVDAGGRVTAHGHALARLPISVRLAHLLVLASARGLAEPAAWLAATLEERESNEDLDLLQRVTRFYRGQAEPMAQRRVTDAVRQYLRLLPDSDARPSAGDFAETIALLTAMAFPERVARRREGSREGIRNYREVAYQCVDGGEVRLPQTDAFAQLEWLAIAHWSIDGDPRSSARRPRSVVVLNEALVRKVFAERLVRSTVVRWDAQAEAVIAEAQEALGAIVLSARPVRDAQNMSTAMLEGVRQMGVATLPWTEAARQWQARVLSLRHWQGAEAWPDVSDEALADDLERWLLPHLQGCSRRAHLESLDLLHILQQQLEYPAQQSLNKLAPTHQTVPTGNRYPLHYTPGQAPALEVKLQELFGLAATPSVCDGRIKVVLHMLSPGRKPVAVTSDLAGFWARSYFEVKKDLRGRYPRHPWPEDPLAAEATARAKPRGT